MVQYKHRISRSGSKVQYEGGYQKSCFAGSVCLGGHCWTLKRGSYPVKGVIVFLERGQEVPVGLT